jgi:hypothetical protein
VPNCNVKTDFIYDYYNNVLTSWTADHGDKYDAKTMFKYLQKDNLSGLYSYAFALNDDIYGSQYNDKLNG